VICLTKQRPLNCNVQIRSFKMPISNTWQWPSLERPASRPTARDRLPLRRPPAQAAAAPTSWPGSGAGRGVALRPPLSACASRSAPVMALAAGRGAGSRHRPSPPSLERPPQHRSRCRPSLDSASGRPSDRQNMCRSWPVQMLGERARVRDANSGLYQFSYINFFEERQKHSRLRKDNSFHL
jgi:hypothetical protein